MYTFLQGIGYWNMMTSKFPKIRFVNNCINAQTFRQLKHKMAATVAPLAGLDFYN